MRGVVRDPGGLLSSKQLREIEVLLAIGVTVDIPPPLM